MHIDFRNHLAAGPLVLLLAGAPALAGQQTTADLDIRHWSASDSIRSEDFLGRPSLYVDKGVALTNSRLRDGVVEMDVAATARTNFIGIAFHASSIENAEVIFLRFGSSGTPEAVQYGPALNGQGVAWQIFHGDGANATATLERGRWIHLKLELAGSVAKLFLGDSIKPLLVVPRLAGIDGDKIGIWTGSFGRGAYFSNIRYAPTTPAPKDPGAIAPGTITNWEISEIFDAERLTPGTLPNLNRMKWQRVSAEPPGVVLLNRYRVAPKGSLPTDPTTRVPLVDSILRGRVPGTKVVFARTLIQAERQRTQLLRFGYSDGVVIFVNGTPLYSGMDPAFLRDLGVMDKPGDAVYLPLKRGANEVVFAVTEYTGGWAFWARLSP